MTPSILDERSARSRRQPRRDCFATAAWTCAFSRTRRLWTTASYRRSEAGIIRESDWEKEMAGMPPSC
jgi:hypothetical protein